MLKKVAVWAVLSLSLAGSIGWAAADEECAEKVEQASSQEERPTVGRVRERRNPPESTLPPGTRGSLDGSYAPASNAGWDTGGYDRESSEP